MENLLAEMKLELTQVTQALRELKADNNTLRKEILGIQNPSSSGSKSADSIKANTLKEAMSTIELDLEKIKESIIIPHSPIKTQDEVESEKTEGKKSIVENGMSNEKKIDDEILKKHLQFTTGQEEPRKDSPIISNCSKPLKDSPVDEGEEDALDEDRAKKYKPKPIRSTEEEIVWLQDLWSELKLPEKSPGDGVTLSGKTIKSISSSIQMSKEVGATTVMIFVNHLPSAMKLKGEFYWPRRGRRIRGPSEIRSQTREAFSFEGGCWALSFLCSFEINDNLSFGICCWAVKDGGIYLRGGFLPSSIPTDALTCSIIEEYSFYSNDCFTTHGYRRKTAEFLINSGSYLARVEMIPGPKSILTVEIDGSLDEEIRPLPTAGSIVSIRNGESVEDATVVNYLNGRSNVSLPSIACIVQITNGLDVSLINGKSFLRKSKRNNFLPHEIPSFTREMFFASNESAGVEGMFSFEIQGTDLGLLIAFKTDGKKNSFGAATFPLSLALCTENAFKNLMDPKTWRNVASKKYAQACQGDQVIEIRNLRAMICMSEGRISTLDIFIISI